MNRAAESTICTASWLTPYHQTRSLDAPASLICQNQGFQTQKHKNIQTKNIRISWSLCQTCLGNGKPPCFSGHFWRAFLKLCTPVLGSSGGVMSLQLTKTQKPLWKINVNTVQREGSFSVSVSKCSNCWLSFAIQCVLVLFFVFLVF